MESARGGVREQGGRTLLPGTSGSLDEKVTLYAEKTVHIISYMSFHQNKLADIHMHNVYN